METETAPSSRHAVRRIWRHIGAFVMRGSTISHLESCAEFSQGPLLPAI